MTDNKNTILAIVLSALVLIGWQSLLCRRKRPGRNNCRPSSRNRAADAGPARPAAHRKPQRRSSPARQPHLRRRPPSTARGAGNLPPRSDRDRQPARLDRAQGRTHRRSGAGQVPRNGRSEVAADRSAVTVRQPRTVLCRVRLDRHHRRQREVPDLRYGVEASKLRPAQRRPSGDADVRQRRGSRIPPHHRGRRQISFHHQGRGGEQERESALALSLCADFAPRHAEDGGLLHPA